MDLTENEARALLARRDARTRSGLERQWRAKFGDIEAVEGLDPIARRAPDFGALDHALVIPSARDLTERVRAGVAPSAAVARPAASARKALIPDLKTARLPNDIGVAMRQVVPPPGEPAQVMLLKKSPVTKFNPSYAWWERAGWSVRFQGGSINDNASYLNGATGGVGARLWGQNYNASDNSLFDLMRSNGILLPYIMPATGIPLIEVRLRADFCEHSIWTNDEVGFSSCAVVTREVVECGFLWKWEDELLQGNSTVSLVPGLYTASTTFSSFGGDGKAVFAKSGDTRNIQVYPKTQIPKGAHVWIFIGLQSRVIASLNDVSASAWIDSSWTIPEVAMATLSL